MSVGEKSPPSKLNRWVDPSFVDFPAESFSVPIRRKGDQVSNSKCEAKKSRKRKGESSSVALKSSLLKEFIHRDQDEPWVDRHAPCSQAELAVHKKKIEEVENWLRLHTHSSQGGVLLLTGPSGCGKTATVQVLCRELGLRIQEWTNPTHLHHNSNSQQDWRMMDDFASSSSSQLAQYKDFLLRANKYNCLKMTSDGGASDRKVILVEDFPNQFYRQPGGLHDILRQFVKTSRCPLVFIVSDSLSGDSSSRFLFPREIQEELHISNISFNPVAPTTMMKVLSRISALEAGKSGGRRFVLDPAALETLCSGSSGDIRSAINSLQFSSLTDSSLEQRLWKMKKDRAGTAVGKAPSRMNQKKKSVRVKEQEEEQAIGGKDASLFLFRALGKILHCKRGSDEGSEPAEPGPGLPSHLSHHHRGPLLVDPEAPKERGQREVWTRLKTQMVQINCSANADLGVGLKRLRFVDSSLVIERSHMSGDFFNLYLHQNYLDFFSQLEDVERASEYLSDADLLTADWTSRSTMGGYGNSVATRGLLHSNSQQVSVGFRPLHKPHWLLVQKKHRENSEAAQSLFRSFCLSPVSLQTHLLPYLAKLTNPMRNQAQIAFIQDVGQMSLKRGSTRLKLEALTDKEPAHLDTEEEEEEGGDQAAGDDALLASQPKPVSSQVEEELIIEEYYSD